MSPATLECAAKTVSEVRPSGRMPWGRDAKRGFLLSYSKETCIAILASGGIVLHLALHDYSRPGFASWVG